MRTAVDVIASNMAADGSLNIGDGVPRKIPRQFRSRQVRPNFSLATKRATQHALALTREWMGERDRGRTEKAGGGAERERVSEKRGCRRQREAEGGRERERER